MTNALTTAIIVFSLGFITSLVYSLFDAHSFPWFSPIHIKIQFWRQFAHCMTLTLILTFGTFLVMLFL